MTTCNHIRNQPASQYSEVNIKEQVWPKRKLRGQPGIGHRRWMCVPRRIVELDGSKSVHSTVLSLKREAHDDAGSETRYTFAPG